MEKDIIKIGTVNLQNNKVNRNGGLRDDGLDTSSLVANHIIEENYDILGTQELTRYFVNNIANKLGTYKLVGGYRYGNNFFSRNIKFINDFNENNNIITRNEVLYEETKIMPFVPNNMKDLKKSITEFSIMPRIVTIAITKSEKGIICAINTHLDYNIPEIQVRQLEFIKNLVIKYSRKYPIVLTGDFNMEISSEHFGVFNQSLNEIGLKRVEVNEPTFEKIGKDNSKISKTIDHIFIPYSWEVINKGTKIIENVTDHKEVFVEAEIRR